MYTVAVQLENGMFVQITLHEELQEAVKLATMLNGQWPRKYVIRDEHGSVIDIIGKSGQK